jgi:hypothetical protein
LLDCRLISESPKRIAEANRRNNDADVQVDEAEVIAQKMRRGWNMQRDLQITARNFTLNAAVEAEIRKKPRDSSTITSVGVSAAATSPWKAPLAITTAAVRSRCESI